MIRATIITGGHCFLEVTSQNWDCINKIVGEWFRYNLECAWSACGERITVVYDSVTE